jgi:hypothetical protein
MSSLEKNRWSRSAKRKTAIASIIIGLGVISLDKADSYMTNKDLEDLTAQAANPQLIRPEALLSPEVLRAEYEKVKSLRDIYGQTAGVRHNIRKLAGFLLQAGPNMIKNRIVSHENIDPEDLDEAGIDRQKMAALVDLGAFNLRHVRENIVDYDSLFENGIREMVIMEDRDPMFYLNYQGFQADKEVPLNRHGDKKDRWTMADMKKLIESLERAGIRVIIGFWGNTGNAKNNPFIKRNMENLRSVVPTSDDINPLSFVTDSEGREMTFAEYVTEQYKKLKKDFGFDGLFLGDGLMGFRSFLDPEGRYDTSQFMPLWTDFYRRVYQGIKSLNPHDTLWAYDCMANGTARARQNGLDLEGISPYVDNYIFQSYGNDAWGEGFMNLPGYSVERDRQEISTLPAALKAKTRYSVGLGDSVEGWWGKKEAIKAKHGVIKDSAGKGTLGVWSNEIIRGLLQEHTF